MDKNEIKGANRKALPQFMLIMVICFSVFAATGYNAVLGIELYRMKF